MTRPATYILLFVIYCFCSSSSDDQATRVTRHPCAGTKAIHLCLGGNRKRTNINDGLTQETDPNADGERRDIQEARRGEGREGEGWGSGGGGESESDGFGGSREGDDDNLRSDLNDLRRQMSGERQLVDIGNHRRRHSPRSAQLDSAIDRLRSLLGTTDLQDVDDRGEEEEWKREERQEEEEEETQRRSNTDTDTDRRYVVSETQTLLSKILDDIEGRRYSQKNSDSVSRK